MFWSKPGQLDDGSPSNDVRVTVRNADGVELGSQHTQVQLLGNAGRDPPGLVGRRTRENGLKSVTFSCPVNSCKF